MSGYWIGKDEAILVRKKEFEQITARVKELEQQIMDYMKKSVDRIATLEQKLQKKQDVIKAMDACIVEYEQQLDKIKERFHCMNETHEHTGAEEILCSIDFQIQQAEKRGYELAWVSAKVEYPAEVLPSYSEAIAAQKTEQDGMK